MRVTQWEVFFTHTVYSQGLFQSGRGQRVLLTPLEFRFLGCPLSIWLVLYKVDNWITCTCTSLSVFMCPLLKVWNLAFVQQSPQIHVHVLCICALSESEEIWVFLLSKFLDFPTGSTKFLRGSKYLVPFLPLKWNPGSKNVIYNNNSKVWRCFCSYPPWI